jgi:adenosylhomocysteine nucleosidase
LLVTAANEEARFYDGDLPLLVTGIEKINAAVRLASVLARARRCLFNGPEEHRA